MRAMLEAAAYLTERRRAAFIFIDGRTFSRRDQIDEVIGAAERAGARWRILHVTCSDAVAEARLNKADPGNPAKNRDVDALSAGEGELRADYLSEARLGYDGGSGGRGGWSGHGGWLCKGRKLASRILASRSSACKQIEMNRPAARAHLIGALFWERKSHMEECRWLRRRQADMCRW